jgi:2-(1,2-epoxy-1,2-dihydrophenyl)acetyl-CoA isomerase
MSVTAVSAFATLSLSIEGGLARLVLNRPERRNCIDAEFTREFREAAIALDENTAVRAVLLSAAGPTFCAGADLDVLTSREQEIGVFLKSAATDLHAGISRLVRMDAPLVVAVRGAAAGGGMGLALMGDIVVAGESARFTTAYTRIGLSPDGGLSYHLPRVVGLRRAQELLLTNRTLSAAEALDMGVVTQVVADADVEQRALEIARSLAGGPTLALGAAKRLLRESFAETLETQLELEARALAAAGRSPDGREGIAAFLEKRPPRFGGTPG